MYVCMSLCVCERVCARVRGVFVCVCVCVCVWARACTCACVDLYTSQYEWFCFSISDSDDDGSLGSKTCLLYDYLISRWETLSRVSFGQPRFWHVCSYVAWTLLSWSCVLYTSYLFCKVCCVSMCHVYVGVVISVQHGSINKD